MSDPPATTPEARLFAAGFAKNAHLWAAPDGQGVFSQEDAIAALDSGEIRPAGITVPDTGIRAFPDELVDRICPPAPEGVPEPPPWLVAQADVIAEATVAKLKPLIGAEVQAALRKGAK
jgi:hypothetical protein